jgi:oxygen-independent coproporphyrinogen-3 oxidase
MALTRDDLVRRADIMAIMCQGAVLFEPMEQDWMLGYREYFAPEMSALHHLQAKGLVQISDEGFQVTPMGWYFVRGVAMLFDRYLQADKNRARFSRII